MILTPMFRGWKPPLSVDWIDGGLSEKKAETMTYNCDCPVCGSVVHTVFEEVNRTPDGFDTIAEYTCITCGRAWRVEDQYIHATRVVKTAEWEHKEDE